MDPKRNQKPSEIEESVSCPVGHNVQRVFWQYIQPKVPGQPTHIYCPECHKSYDFPLSSPAS